MTKKKKKKIRFSGSNLSLSRTKRLTSGNTTSSDTTNNTIVSSKGRNERDRSIIQLDNSHQAENKTLMPNSGNTEAIKGKFMSLACGIFEMQ